MGDYVELHCHSAYSLLDGASTVEALVAQAAQLKMPALALTDHDALYGAVPFVSAARTSGVRPILGAEKQMTEWPTFRGAALEQHERIYAALSSRDPHGAADAMEAHIRASYAILPLGAEQPSAAS